MSKDKSLTAGVAVLLVSGNNLVPSPPPSMTAATSFGFARRLSRRGISMNYIGPTNNHNHRLMEINIVGSTEHSIFNMKQIYSKRLVLELQQN